MGLVNNIQCLAEIEAHTGWAVDFTSPTNFEAPVNTPEAFAREMHRLRAQQPALAEQINEIRGRIIMPQDIS